MKVKLGLMGIFAAAGLALFGGASASVFASNDAPAPQPAVTATDERPAFWRWEFPFPWIRFSIVDDAAQVIGMPREELRDRLREGRSLAEVANNHGVGDPRLKEGILSGEWDDLVRQVRDTRLTWREADAYYNDLVNHIDEIIRYHS